MALTSLLLLAALASSAIAQGDVPAVEPTSASSMVMMMTSTQMPMETVTSAPAVGNVSAEEVQRDHFFVSGIRCRGEGGREGGEEQSLSHSQVVLAKQLSHATLNAEEESPQHMHLCHSRTIYSVWVMVPLVSTLHLLLRAGADL